MRGGSIPIAAWATILLVLAIGNAVWNSKLLSAVVAFAAALIIYLAALLFWLMHRDAIRRGPPAPETEPEAVPAASTGAVFAALSVATIVFGLVWAKFFVYFGAGTLVLSLGRLVIEVRAERITNRRVRQELERR